MIDQLLHELYALGVTDDSSPRLIPLVVRMAGAGLLGGGASLLFFLWRRKERLSRAFLLSLPLLAITTAFVIGVVGDNMIRAFGLIGAISMVRFRTKIKGALEMAYIFLVISLGLACGVSMFPAALAALTMFAGTFAVISLATRMMDISKHTGKKARLDVHAEGAQ